MAVTHSLWFLLNNMYIRFQYFFILLLATLQSCYMCSQRHVNPSLSDGELEVDQRDHIEEGWSSLSEVGYPIISDTIPNILLKRFCYSVSYNSNTRQPNWVAWKLTAEHTDGIYGRINTFFEDEEIPVPRATLNDYRGSGWSRGHMCPAGDNKWDKKAMYDTFLLTNVCPQNANLNSGVWNHIEMDCRKWAKKYGSIYIICGPIFFKSQEHERIGPNRIPVPEAFFKVILCLEGTPKGIGFICRNTDGNRKKDFYVNSIRQVERITGYQFFPNLEDSVKSQIYDMDNITIW